MRFVRGEVCPECAGGVTREAQKNHLAELVECAAAERVPRVERAVLTAEQVVEGMGSAIIELFRLPLGPGDVLMWHAPPDVPNRQAARQMRFLRKLLPPENRPSVFAVLRPGEHMDAFNVPDVSDEGILTGVREIGEERLAEVRPKPLDGGLVTEPERPMSGWRSFLDGSIADRGLKPVMDVVCKWAEHHGYDLTPKLTFAELMDEGNSLMSAPKDTPERRQRVTEALERECLAVIEDDAWKLKGLVSEAVAKLRESTPMDGCLIVIAAYPSTWTALGRPSAILGYHCNMNGMTSDGTLLVTASKEGESFEPERIVLVKLRGELGKLAELHGRDSGGGEHQP
jgi:hypothetical protein